MDVEDEDKPKYAKTRASRRLVEVDLDKIHQKFLTVLQREANRLLDISHVEKLGSNESKSLVNYLKLLKEFQEFELNALENLTDDELKERAKINQNQGE